jgi:hypothetical protein
MSAREAKHVSVGQFYKGAQVRPQYPTQPTSKEEETPQKTKAREDFGFAYAKKTRMFGLCIYVETLFKAGSPEEAVKRPEGINANEWASAHIVALHNFANSLYREFCEDPDSTSPTSSEKKYICSRKTCPTMTAGSRAEYLWADGRTVRMPTSIPACDYILHVLQWLHYELTDSGNFPRRDFATYGNSFLSVHAKRCFKRLFRVFAHFRAMHYLDMPDGGASSWRKRFNAILLHLLCFVQEYKFVDSKEFSVLHRVFDDYQRSLKPKKK